MSTAFPQSTDEAPLEVAIIGAGFGGMYMLHKLRALGFAAKAFEAGTGVGGTWYWNRYPGARCDIESLQYSYSFDEAIQQDWTWTERFAPQTEILQYANYVAERLDLLRDIVFEVRIAAGRYDAAANLWRLETADGRSIVAQKVVTAVGCLSSANLPDIEGVRDFAGETYHTGQWPKEGVDFTGKRVAVIGTGASAIQIVPEIVKDVAGLQLYQRTPAWVMPRPNNPIPEGMQRVFANVPGTRAAMRAGIYWIHEAVGFAMTKQPRLLKLGELMGKWNIRRSIKDRELRRKLTPDYRAGCKRILNSDTYYRGIADPKTEVITDRIARFTPTGIVTADGRERPVDVVVFATGFHVTDSYTYVDIKGPDGEDLVDRWNAEGIAALRGITVAGMPNLVFLLGPNTALGHNSVVFMIESQIRYAGHAIAAVDRAGAQALAPTRDAQDRYNDELQDELSGTVWSTGGCRSWYLDEHGVNRTLWSGMTWQYWLATRRFKASEYTFTR